VGIDMAKWSWMGLNGNGYRSDHLDMAERGMMYVGIGIWMSREVYMDK
jgi:hypothetical protein